MRLFQATLAAAIVAVALASSSNRHPAEKRRDANGFHHTDWIDAAPEEPVPLPHNSDVTMYPPLPPGVVPVPAPDVPRIGQEPPIWPIPVGHVAPADLSMWAKVDKTLKFELGASADAAGLLHAAAYRTKQTLFWAWEKGNATAQVVSPEREKWEDVLKAIKPMPGGAEDVDLTTMDPESLRVRKLQWWKDAARKAGKRISDTGMATAIVSVVNVTVADNSHIQNINCSEWYRLSFDLPKQQAVIEADTIWGAMRAFETMSQLTQYDYGSDTLLVSPYTIEDFPRYPFRGLLVDTARHWLDVDMLITALDILASVKMNVMMWHAADDQSFPMIIPEMPELAAYGAFSPRHTYTPEDVTRVFRAAAERGINIIPGFDGPAHMSVWCKVPQYHNLCIDGKTLGPGMGHLLDLSNQTTYDIYETIYKFILQQAALANATVTYINLGGDEVLARAWTNNPTVNDWIVAHNITDPPCYFHAVRRNITTSLGIPGVMGWESMRWCNLPPQGWRNYTIQDGVFFSDVWDPTDVRTQKQAAEDNEATILSSDCFGNNMDGFFSWYNDYMCEPANFTTDTSLWPSVMGGHGVRWGERTDATDWVQNTFPGVAGAAEKLWSPYNLTVERVVLGYIKTTVQARLSEWRCRQVAKGVNIEPMTISFCDKPFDYVYEPPYNQTLFG